MNENSLKVHMRIAAWRKQIDLLSAKKKKVRPASSKKDRYKVSRVKIKSLIRSFQIKKFHLTIDTGEMPVNAVLYPAFYFLGKYNNKSIEMNFMNQNDIVLEVKNNFARMIRAYYFS
ncbi:hypothetical protein [Daejeonella oryzae]|uniref:hypothetical protein n=1 Tax=Daejeonella oryzae TaxID=1122943 RepID=UPI0012DEFEA6|nr:hypothetical protein [Daejeonella oryzae]